VKSSIFVLAVTVLAGVGFSACGSPQSVTSATPTLSKTLIQVALTGPLSGSFTACRTDTDGALNATVLSGTVVDASGDEIGTAEFDVVHVGKLAPGAYFLATGTGAPAGSRAVGTLTITPLAGRPLPVVTLGQKYGGESQAIFLTQTGTLHVANDGSTTIRTDLIDQQATQQIADHPLISGTWRCAA
jgi:hypothetical protein